MNTFENVVEMFLSNVKDINFLDYEESELIQELGIKVKTVIAKARVFKDLHFNSVDKEFNRTITDMEATIISNGLIIEWINPKMYNYELLELQIGSKNFNQLSNANLLREMQNLRTLATSEFNELICDYDYDSVDWNGAVE